eukprot:2231240-Rhodomonas_salina.2
MAGCLSFGLIGLRQTMQEHNVNLVFAWHTQQSKDRCTWQCGQKSVSWLSGVHTKPIRAATRFCRCQISRSSPRRPDLASRDAHPREPEQSVLAPIRSGCIEDRSPVPVMQTRQRHTMQTRCKVPGGGLFPAQDSVCEPKHTRLLCLAVSPPLNLLHCTPDREPALHQPPVQLQLLDLHSVFDSQALHHAHVSVLSKRQRRGSARVDSSLAEHV